MDVGAELRARLRPTVETALVGIEHEFVVTDDERGPVDFRQLIRSLPLGGRRLDPADPLAVRGLWGGVITADGREAEIATPPVALRPGFAGELDEWVARGTAELVAALGRERHVAGYSTHLSVAVADDRVVRVARRFARDFALGQMLLLDRADSPGLLVRPRRGRLELGGEFVAGSQRRAAAVYAAAATAAAVAREERRSLPFGRAGRTGRTGSAAGAGRRPRPKIEPARGRYGFYVDRGAFGVDLYVHGRRARVAGGRSAQDVLLESWTAARPFAIGTSTTAEVELVDDVVEGRRPLPLEAAEADAAVPAPSARTAATGRVVEPRRRPGLAIEAVVATWDGSVLQVADGAGAAVFLTVPRRHLDGFLHALDAGELDDVLAGAVAAAPTLPALLSAGQLDELDAYGSVGPRGNLVPDERDPLTGRLGGAGRGGRQAREQKDRHDPPKRRVPRSLVLAAAIFGALLLLVGLAAAVSRQGDDAQQVAAIGPTTTPSVAPPAPTAGWSGVVTIVQTDKSPVMGSDATTQAYNLGVSLGGYRYEATFGGEVDANLATVGVAKAAYRAFYDHDGYYCYGGTRTMTGEGTGPVTLSFSDGDAYPFFVSPLYLDVKSVDVGEAPGCTSETTNQQPIGGTDNFNVIGAPEQPVDEPTSVRSGTRTFTTTTEDTVLSPSAAGDGTYDFTPTTFKTVTVITWHLTKLPDRDHDGVPDADDRCPSKPSPATSADGCVPPDSDKDRVPDAADACAATPDGQPVDETGCPTEETTVPHG